MSDKPTFAEETPGGDDPLWYRDAIIYQVHVRAFADSNGDGIGDFQGLASKLDYLQDLGVTALWLLPFYPSPLRDDGYDIANYTDVNPVYGSMEDFESFLAEAHRRGLRVITELVLNHTSDQHPWFQRARRAKAGSAARDYYVWSDDPKKYPEVRIIFQDFEPSNWTWDPVAEAYYWHRFYAHQPDLNFDNADVHQALVEALDFWFSRGVDGLRLDAIPYLYEREGTNGENLPETHAFLRKLRGHVDDRFRNRMLLAEANQWPEDAAAYFGQGDECHMAFNFPLMPRLFMALRMEERFPILDILQQTPVIPDTCQWALFLRNHDELTLEMVTDEERDYMYRLYAQEPQMRINLGIRRRLAPLLENHRAKIELLNGLLFSLPGTPVMYYGDEIGMGDNIYLGDRNGVRTPMQWNAERNAGFSHANPQRLFLPAIIDPEYHYQTVNVEAQHANPHSLLWWIKRLIGVRKRYQAFGRGSVEFIRSENPKVLAFVRRYQEERILVVANLSRLPQYVELDLREYQGLSPVEVFGRTPFPPVTTAPYPFSIGSYGFFWLDLEPPKVVAATAPERQVYPALRAIGTWENVLRGEARHVLQSALPDYLEHCRWFHSAGRQVETVAIQDVIPIPCEPAAVQVAMLQVRYSDGDIEFYCLPLGFAADGQEDGVVPMPQRIIARLAVSPRERGEGNADSEGFLYDALGDRGLSWALVDCVAQQRRFRGLGGELLGSALSSLEQIYDPQLATVEPTVQGLSEGSVSVIYGDRLFLKIFRRVEAGPNPLLEVSRFLSERTSFRHTPPQAGTFEYRRSRAESVTLAVVEQLVPNQGTIWVHTLDALSRYYEQARAHAPLAPELIPKHHSLLEFVPQDPPQPAQELFGTYLETSRLLGQRTAELHIALASAADDPVFAPEAFTTLYQRSLYQSLRIQVRRAMRLLGRKLLDLPLEVRDAADRLLREEDNLLRRGQQIFETRITALRIRGHGDYDLTKVLHTGNDIAIVGLEGDLSRPLSDRRRKRTPIRDVASMLFSFGYAGLAALEHSGVRPEDIAGLTPWMLFWQQWASAAFLKAYLTLAEPAGIVPSSTDEQATLLDFYLLKRAVNNLQGDLLRNSDRVRIPLQSLAQLLETGAPEEAA